MCRALSMRPALWAYLCMLLQAMSYISYGGFAILSSKVLSCHLLSVAIVLAIDGYLTLAKDLALNFTVIPTLTLPKS